MSMRFLIKLKSIALIAIWTVACIGLYAVIALGEAMLEIGAGAAGAVVGQGGSASGLMDLTGDIIQWGIGLMWLAGVLVLWVIKKLLTSRGTRAATAGVAITATNKAVPHVISKHPMGRAASGASGPAARMLSAMMARKARKS
jgi:hypothetical protein